MTLSRKKEHLAKEMDSTVSRREELFDLQKNNPDRYPDFLKQLRDLDYIQLYDHIIQMRKFYYNHEALRLINQKMTLKQFTEIVLASREAVIQKVKKSIPVELSKNVIFIVGNIGSGISTTACFLGGEEMMLSRSSSYDSKNNPGHYITQDPCSFSATFLPNIHINKDLVTVDMAGLNYRDSVATNLGLELALKKLIAEYQPGIMVVTEARLLDYQSYQSLYDLKYRLDRMFENKSDYILGLTRYHYSNYIKFQSDDGELLDKMHKIESSIRELDSLLSSIENQIQTQSPEQDSSLEKEKKTLEEILKSEQSALVKCKIKLQRFKDQRIAYKMQQSETEETIKKRIGISKSIRLVDLSNPNALTLCQTRLFEFGSHSAKLNPHLQLDIEHYDYLINLFKKEMLVNSYTIPTMSNKINHFSILKNLVQEHSLTTVLMPEFFSNLLRLPEFDSGLIKKLDLHLINACLFYYVQSLRKLRLDWLEKAMRHNNYIEFANKINVLRHSNKWQLMHTKRGNYSTYNMNTEDMLLLPCFNVINYLSSKVPYQLYNFMKSLSFDRLAEIEITDESFVKALELELSQVFTLFDDLVQIQSMLTENVLASCSIEKLEDLMNVMSKYRWYDEGLLKKLLTNLNWFTSKDLTEIATDRDHSWDRGMLITQMTTDPHFFERIIKTEDDFWHVKSHFPNNLIFKSNSRAEAVKMMKSRQAGKEFSQVSIAAGTLGQAFRDQYSFFNRNNIPAELLIEIAIQTADFNVISEEDARNKAHTSFNKCELNNSVGNDKHCASFNSEGLEPDEEEIENLIFCTTM